MKWEMAIRSGGNLVSLHLRRADVKPVPFGEEPPHGTVFVARHESPNWELTEAELLARALGRLSREVEAWAEREKKNYDRGYRNEGE